MAAAASLVVGIATAFAAGPAGAYPNPSGTVSGNCAPASQNTPLSAVANDVTCTFTFTVASSDPVDFTTSAGTITAHSTNVAGTTASAKVSGVTCGTSSSVIPINVTITSHPAVNSDVSGSAVSTVSCGGTTDTHTHFVNCSATPFPGPIPGFDAKICSFTTDAPDGTAVTYNASGGGFPFSGDHSVFGGAFQVEVVYPSGGHSSVTGAVSATSTTGSSSATGTVN